MRAWSSAKLPEDSPFGSLADARQYAGPLPYTFDYEAETNSIVMVRGRRDDWDQRPVDVHVLENTFLDQPRFAHADPVLANAFYIAGRALPVGARPAGLNSGPRYG